MQTTWILAADASRARIFEVEKHNPPRVHEVEGFDHAQGRAHIREINSDADGRFSSKGGTQAHVSQPAVDAAQHEMEIFSRQISDYLDQAANEHRFDRLWLMASPKVLGLLRQQLGKTTQKLVEEEVAKDISWFDTRDIEAYLQRHTQHH